MPRKKQPFKRISGDNFHLVVMRVRGPNTGKPYRRSFSSQSAMNAYIKRNTGAGTAEKAISSYNLDETPFLTKRKKQTLVSDFVGWAKEGLGLQDMSKEEVDYLRAFKEETGRNPKIWEDPYLVERTGDFADKAFLAMTLAAGPGLAVAGVKAAVAGTEFATSAVVRATTKSAVKSALKKAAVALVKKRTVKETLKVAAKGTLKAGGTYMDADYKKYLIGEYKNMITKGINNITK